MKIVAFLTALMHLNVMGLCLCYRSMSKLSVRQLFNMFYQVLVGVVPTVTTGIELPFTNYQRIDGYMVTTYGTI